MVFGSDLSHLWVGEGLLLLWEGTLLDSKWTIPSGKFGKFKKWKECY